jgi:hypothetical protein
LCIYGYFLCAEAIVQRLKVQGTQEEEIQKEWWGLLGPEELVTQRRTRTLGVGAAVRKFNDLAVPGLGGVWFGKQLFLGALGVAVAERARAAGLRVQNIETANAVEALACWLALKNNGWKAEPRLRGATKMYGTSNLAFSTVRRSRFYVTQPMRMATVQPLRALGIVESPAERFNTFTTTVAGQQLIEAVCENFNPCYHSSSVLEHLVNWTKSNNVNVQSSNNLAKALSPLDSPSKAAREVLMEYLVRGGGADSARRGAALAWIESIRANPKHRATWTARPDSIDDTHWRDMHAGGLFFEARNAAFGLLDLVEAGIANQHIEALPLDSLPKGPVTKAMNSLQRRAGAFLDLKHDPSSDALAGNFCRECINDDPSRLLQTLVQRDGRVLALRAGMIVRGPAFRGAPVDLVDQSNGEEHAGTETAVTGDIDLPAGISYRIRNLFMLNLDLHGKLDRWLEASDTGDAP